MAIDNARVAQAADAIVARGESPTLAAVRAEIGGGSYTVISEGMRAWRRAREEAQIKAEIVDIPRELQEAFNEAGRLVWRQATEQHAAKLAQERQALEEAHERYEAERRDAVELADEVSAELDRATVALEQEKTALEEARQALLDERLAAEQARSETRELSAKVGGLYEQLQTLEAELAQSRGELASAGEERGRLEGRLSSAEALRAGLQDELNQTRAAVADAQSDRKLLAAELTLAKEQIETERAARLASEQDATQLRERLGDLQAKVAQLTERTARLDDLRAMLEPKAKPSGRRGAAE